MRILEQHICPNCFASGYRDERCPKCGYNEVVNLSPLTLPVGALLGERYLIGRTLGVGGFGITYLTLDRQRNALSAIKEYFPRSFATRDVGYNVTASGQTSSPVFAHGYQVFCSEAKVLSHFNDESLIVQVQDYFEDNNTAYLVMEYLDGLNTKALLRNAGGVLPLNQAMAILFSMLQALSLVHNQGFLHRDVSPENIFVTRDGQIKLIDFGSTRFFVGEKSRNLSVILKPGFAPPEQYSSRGNQGPWTDIYALAATFYYLATGIRVAEAPDRLADDSLVPIAELLPNLHPKLAELIDQCLRLDYRERIQSTAEFTAELEAASAQDNKTKVGVDNANSDKPSGGTPYVLVLNGNSKGNKWALPSDLDIIIGRSTKQSNIVINAPGISRKHCTVRYNSLNGNFTVTDVSSNGTFIKKQRLQSKTSQNVNAPSELWLSENSIAIQIGVE